MVKHNYMPIKINNKVFVLKQDVEITKSIKLKKGNEIQVMRDVVYMGGFPIPPNQQKLIFEWILNNQHLLKDDTRTF